MRSTSYAVSIAFMLLAGCATKPPEAAAIEPELVIRPKVVDTGCQWIKPIYLAKTDVVSDATARQVLAHDRIGQKMCGWKGTN